MFKLPDTARGLVIGLLLASGGPAFAQGDVDLRYRFHPEGEKDPAPSGILWLYHSSWYGLNQFKLAAIEKGRARIRLDEGRLRAEVRPHPNTEAYVLVLQFPGPRWYRTGDLDPASLLRVLSTRLNALGRARVGPTGETILTLPPPARRRITLQHEDGRPAANLDVPVAIYLYDRNHCGFHVGPDLGTHRTDATGTVEVAAPLIPLYLRLRHYEQRGDGPAGPAYWTKIGLKTGPEATPVLRRTWELPEEDLEIEVRSSDGSPIVDASVIQAIRTTECGAGSGSVGTTDGAGAARVRIARGATERILLEKEGRTRELSADEMKALFLRRRITLAW